MAENNDSQGNLDLEDAYGKTEAFINDNKNRISIVFGAIAVVIAAVFAYKKLIVEPNEKESIEQLWKSEYYLLDKNDFESAIHGDSLGEHKGLKQLVEEYGGYSGGEIARYELGVAYLNTGEWDLAIETLEQVDFQDDILGAVAKGAIGDAYMEKGNGSKARKYFIQAANHSGHTTIAPLYLNKAGIASLILGEKDESENQEALRIYKELLEKYPEATEAGDAKKYIAMLSYK